MGVNLEDIERRLLLLEAKEAVARTIHRYATAIDYGHDDDWVDCFLDDGVFEVRSPVAETFRYVGRAELAAMIPTHTKAPSRWHKHIVSQLDIAIDGDRATAQTYILRVDRDDRDGDTPKIWVFGRYLDRLRRCDDGVWRFAYRTIELEGVNPAQWAMLDTLAGENQTPA